MKWIFCIVVFWLSTGCLDEDWTRWINYQARDFGLCKNKKVFFYKIDVDFYLDIEILS